MADKTHLDLLWVLLSAVLVLLMQGGFLCLESGLTRSKNAINVAMKNGADLVLALLVWWLVGFGLMFGESVGGWIGATLLVPDLHGNGPWLPVFFLFQLMFCATAATIVSGAVAERMRFSAYHLVALLTIALIYPVFGHWAWGGALGVDTGWLAERGFVDFAGSTVVHSVGGWVALAAVLVIGPRRGRFVDGTARPIPGSNLPLAMLGVILFVVGWIGFNGGSTLAFNAAVPAIVANTVLAAAAGGLAAYLLGGWFSSPYMDRAALPMNGIIAGLVAITAGCHGVAAGEAVVIGAAGAVVMFLAGHALGGLRIDDAIGAIPVHLAAGAWGTLAVALFGDPAVLGTGLDTWAQLRVQAEGVVVCGIWAFTLAYLVLRAVDRVRPLRVTPEDEDIGLNVTEHGAKTELVDLMTAMRRQEDAADLSLRLPVEPFTEVGQIAAQHNRLMDALEHAVAQTRAIVRDLRDGIITFDARGVLTSFNPGAEHIFGLPAAAAVGTPVAALLRMEGVADGADPVAALVERDKLELSGLRADGETFFMELTVTESSHQGDSYTALVRDVTDRRRVEEQLYQEKERAQVTLESIADGVITTDPGGRIVYMNPVAERLTAWDRGKAEGLPLHRVFPVVNSPAQMPSDALVREVLHQGDGVLESKHGLLFSRDGVTHAVLHSAAPIRDPQGVVKGLVVVFHDVTQARALERQLSYQATHDGLTGLINRVEFENRLESLIANARRDATHHVLLYIDLDQFKLVNDVSGHVAGDELLRQLAPRLKRHLRASDTLARLGGDEFGVLLSNCAPDKGVQVAEQLRESVRVFRFPWEGREFAVGASIGLVPIAPESGDLSEVLSHADAACYAAKDAGRNKVHVYEADDIELSRRKGQMKWVSRIREALDRDRFRLYYQVIAPVRPQPGRGRHFEVLLRMVEADGSEVPPGAFIPAAERFSLMEEIDQWVVQATLAWLGAHREWIPDPVGLCSINLSGASMGSETCLELITRGIREHRLPASALCFEITETAAIANLERATRFIAELKAIGCSFALDDFGSGLSSFGYLKNLAVDYLKIDGAFVRDLSANPVDQAMVQSIVGVGRVMGLSTIAEFVESAAILECLRDIGVDYAQGYHLGRPQPLDAFPLPGAGA